MFHRITLSRPNHLIDCWYRINGKQAFLVALSLALITQSQLRITALSAGIGELLILLLFLGYLFAKLFGKSVQENSSINGYDRISFLGFIFFLMVLGPTVFHYHAYDPAMKSLAIHNIVAYLFVALLFLYFSKGALNIELIAWLFAVTLLALISVELLILPKRLLFFEGVRFTALSNNPNQLALAMLFLPYIFFRAIITQASVTSRTFNGVCSFSSLVCIHFILCDSIFLANLFLVFLSIFFIFSRKKQLVYCIVPILILVTSLNILPSKIVALQRVVLHSSFSTMIPDALKKIILAYSPRSSSTVFESEALFRSKLWREAMAMSQQHPLFGFGAGGLVVLPEGKRMEAHNTFLDVSIQSGLTGLIFYLAFLVFVFMRLYRKNRLDLLLMFYSLIIFSCFHFILRQPIVWFYFAYLLNANSDVTHRKREDSAKGVYFAKTYF